MAIQVTLAEYVRAVQTGSIRSWSAPTQACPSCGKRGRRGILIRIRSRGSKLACPACLPSNRVCARCQRSRPLLDFRSRPSLRLGYILDSYCSDCERARNLSHYERSKLKSRVATRAQRCRTCESYLPAREFSREPRNKSGLKYSCNRCLNERARERYATLEGRKLHDDRQRRHKRQRGRETSLT